MERLDPAVFDALMRAVDAGLPIDAVRVRAWIEKALAASALPITLAEGAITITAGQARLNNTIVRTPAADLTAGGSFNLGRCGNRCAGRARRFTEGKGGVAKARPELVITLKGPLAAPKRTIDVAALSSWLALRSVEQQSKKLDVLEGRAPRPMCGRVTSLRPQRRAPPHRRQLPPCPRLRCRPM